MSASLTDYLDIGAAALRKAALSEDAKGYLLSNKPLYTVLRKAAERYIGGETLGEIVPKVQAENSRGFKCSIEFMGERTRSQEEANHATTEFLRIVEAIRSRGLDATVSLDVSHIGLALSGQLAAENLERICTAAAPNIEVTVSAENVAYTDAVLGCYTASADRFPNLSITVQAYLHRTKDDLRELLNYPGRVRVVKGAFEPPPGHALPRGPELNDAYLRYVDTLLEHHHPLSIATHDHEVQQRAVKLLDSHRPRPQTYEFESLFGICTEQLADLKDAGQPAKMYIVYGTEWYLYLCNRIAEYPLNLFRALDDMIG